jgi:hypothetical protein
MSGAPLGKAIIITPRLVLSNGKTTVFDFAYESYEIRKPVADRGLPTPHGAKEELVIKIHRKGLWRLLLSPLFRLRRRRRFRPLSRDRQRERDPAHDPQSDVLSARFAQSKRTRIETLYGSWAHECNLDETILPHGVFSFGSDTGLSSARHNPFFLIKEKGTTRFEGNAYGFNFVYSGSHLESIERDTWDTLTIQAGISPLGFKKSLAKGASFKTPMGVFTFLGERGEWGQRGNSTISSTSA